MADRETRRFKVDDWVRIKAESKSIGLGAEGRCLEDFEHAFDNELIEQIRTGYIRRICGNPYIKQDSCNYIEVASGLKGEMWNKFAPRDLELIEPLEGTGEKNISGDLPASESKRPQRFAEIEEKFRKEFKKMASDLKNKSSTAKARVETVSGEIEEKEIRTDGQLFGFSVGDIITCECGECHWDVKYVLVKGFNFDQQRLYGIPFDDIEIDYNVMPQESYYKQKLRIVQRDLNHPRLYYFFKKSMDNPPEFKVGDEVIVTNGTGAGHQGEIIAINPTPHLVNPYVVKLFGYQIGEKSPEYLIEVRNPNTLPSSCIFKEPRELCLVSDFERELKEISGEGTAEATKEAAEKKEKKITLEEQAVSIVSWYIEEILDKGAGTYPLIRDRAGIEPGKPLGTLLSDETADSIRIAIRELGVFLYQMLTGHSERTDISFRLDGYPEIQKYNPDISIKFSEIIKKMLNGDYKDIEALKSALSEITTLRKTPEFMAKILESELEKI